MIDFNKRMTKNNMQEFADYVLQLQRKIGFKVSSRGWCYQLESERLINKDQFNKVENWINRCRKNGLLPIDFVADEQARGFSGIEVPEDQSIDEYVGSWAYSLLNCGEYFTPDWWQNEEYYIQVVVEKIDLKTLFQNVCFEYHIPIATSKGWSSMSQRAEYAKRFSQAEAMGLQPVLLYCGDHDPDGVRISDFLHKNLYDLKDIVWSDGTPGYDPDGLIIERFGLNADFIELHQLTWIDNLITGSGKNLASPRHANYHMDYVQDYLDTFGERKCEANAIVPIPDIARELIRDVIESYLGEDALSRFEEVKNDVKTEVVEYMDESGSLGAIEDLVTAAGYRLPR